MARRSIIFDFVNGRAYRGDSPTLSDALKAKAAKLTKPRVVKTVIGVPAEVLAPKK